LSFPEDGDERRPEGAPEEGATPEPRPETPEGAEPRGATGEERPEAPAAAEEARPETPAAETPRAEPPADAPEPVRPAERELAPAPAATEATEPPAEAAKPKAPSRHQKKSSGPKKWYIVHTYSGHEARAKQALLDRAKSLGLEEFFEEVLIPEETVVEMVKGEKRTSKRKYFPGYILVRMELTDETWHAVRGTPKITGFVGGAKNPPPISDEEVAKMTAQIKEGAAKPKPKIALEEGENVRVVSGPFANFSGFIDEVMEDKEKVRVMVQVFGRATPVVLDYIHVEKA